MADTVITVAPDAVIAAGGWAAAGGGTIAANLADAVDATSASSAASTGTLEVSTADPVLPSDAVIKQVAVRFRGRQTAGTGQVSVSLHLPASGVYRAQSFGTKTVALVTSASAVSEYVGPATTTVPWAVDPSVVMTPESPRSGTRAWTAADLAALRLRITPQNPPDDLFMSRAVAEVTYNRSAAANAVTATGFTVTTRPTVSWAYSDPESEIQTAYELKVFTAAQLAVPGFDPSYSPAAWSSGVVASAESSSVIGLDLSNGVTYRVYVRVRDAGSNTFGAWGASADFVQNVLLPAAPQVSAAAETATARMTLTLQGLDNVLSKLNADIENTVSGWVAEANCAVAADTVAGHYLGAAGALRLTATANGHMSARTPNGAAGAAVAAGTAYVGRASFKAAAASGRNCRVHVRWYSAAGALLSSSSSADVVSSTGAFVEAVVVAVAPANAAFAALAVEVFNAAAGEIHRTDWHSIAPAKLDGAAPAAWSRGGLLATQRVRVERSDDGGVTWATVYGLSAVDLPDTTQRAVVYDYTAPPGGSRYRAVTTAADGTNALASDPGAAVVTDLPPVDGTVWLKDPADPARNVRVSLYGDAWERVKRERVHFFEALGRTYPVPQSGGLLGDVIPVTFQTRSDADWRALTLLLDSGRTLLLQTDMAGIQWWVRRDAEVAESLARSVERLTKPYRRLRTQFVQVDPPA